MGMGVASGPGVPLSEGGGEGGRRGCFALFESAMSTSSSTSLIWFLGFMRVVGSCSAASLGDDGLCGDLEEPAGGFDGLRGDLEDSAGAYVVVSVAYVVVSVACCTVSMRDLEELVEVSGWCWRLVGALEAELLEVSGWCWCLAGALEVELLVVGLSPCLTTACGVLTVHGDLVVYGDFGG